MAAGLDPAAVELVNSEQLLRHPTERIKLQVHQSSGVICQCQGTYFSSSWCLDRPQVSSIITA